MSSHAESRRNFLKSSVATALAAAASASAQSQTGPSSGQATRPNVILYLSDQFRADFVGANGGNSSTATPNIDAMCSRGKNFTHAVTNQPVCGPSRSVLMSSRYATEAGVWHNGLPLDHSLPTLAGELKKSGYSTNLIGKWHLANGKKDEGGGPGAVKPADRGGFDDLWEGANGIENTSHPYYGTIWDRDMHPIEFKDEYRVDFLTDRAEKFLRQKHDKPFFLFVSQLEPHQQNDMGQPIAPKGYADQFKNCNVPADLRALPGTWQYQLPDYYGCIKSIDESVGRIRKILEEEHLADNTLFIFMSDHGCHFMTRNKEYKRSTHNSSLRVPLIFDGPGFRGEQKLDEIVGIIDIAPTILAACGVEAPKSWKGHNIMPLVNDLEARKAWPNQQFVQISESMTGRAIRTKDWTYCVADMSGSTKEKAATEYHEYQFYDQRADPAELVNLAGREEYKAKAAELRDQLLKLLIYAGEPTPTITPAKLYP